MTALNLRIPLADTPSMRCVVALCLLVVACASGPPELRLQGAWQSNRDLTLAEFRQVPGITNERLEALSAPDLFGHMVHIYRPNEAIVIYEGECSITPYEVVEYAAGYVDIRYYDSFFEEPTSQRIFFGPNLIWLRVGDAREIFTRVELEAVEAQHDCVRPLLETCR